MGNRKLTYAAKTNVVAVGTRAQQATAEDFNEIKESVNLIADENTAKGKILTMVHNSALTFSGFADTSTATPGSHVANNAWIVTETGTIFGIAATIGQIIVDNGSVYVSQNISPTVSDNAITTAKIEDGAVTVGKIEATSSPEDDDVFSFHSTPGTYWSPSVGSGSVVRQDSPELTGTPIVPGYVKDVIHEVQSLDTDFDTISFDANNGYNGIITISSYIGFTLVMSNLVAGTSGKITIINDGQSGSMIVSGYVNMISPALFSFPNIIDTSETVDVFQWYYDGTRLYWTGEKGFTNSL